MYPMKKTLPLIAFVLVVLLALFIYRQRTSGVLVQVVTCRQVDPWRRLAGLPDRLGDPEELPTGIQRRRIWALL